MPRLSQGTPKYRKHRATGKAVVTITGVDHYLGPYGTKASKVEYDRLVGEWLAAGRPSTRQAEAHEITVTEVVIRFWRFAQLRYEKDGKPTKTSENYKRVLKSLRERYGHTLAIDFGPLALKAMRARFVESGCNRRTANDYAHLLRAVFKWAASEQLIPATVPEALATVDGLRRGESVARESEPVRPVDDAIVEATLPHLPPIVADMVKLQRLTGARPGEICAMRSADVDRTGEVWLYRPAEHKTQHFGKDRLIYLGPKAQDILRPYLLRSAEAFCFSPAESEKKRRARLTNERQTPWSCGNTIGSNRKRKPETQPGRRYDVHAYRRAISRACEIAFEMPAKLRFPDRQKDANGDKLPKLEADKLREKARQWRAVHCWSPHQLRHTAATQVRKEFGLESAQVVLGHSNMRITEVYAEKNSELAIRVAKQVG